MAKGPKPERAGGLAIQRGLVVTGQRWIWTCCSRSCLQHPSANTSRSADA